MDEPYTYEAVAKMIDHSLLSPALTVAELEDGCTLAVRYNVASVCIMPYYVRRCAELLAGSTVQPSTTVGFPHGGHATSIKLAEAEQAIEDGATELDMVINISQARSGNWAYVGSEIQKLTDTCHASGAKIKVIFENAYHDEAAKIRLCEICGDAGVDWVKTSTGYAATGATIEDLKLMRKHSPPHVQVKAAGGVRDLDTLLTVKEIGVTRVGATRTAAILDECRRRIDLKKDEKRS
jgi:deoxyribose-phosphate aldolase